jgi:hypothetical protein
MQLRVCTVLPLVVVCVVVLLREDGYGTAVAIGPSMPGHWSWYILQSCTVMCNAFAEVLAMQLPRVQRYMFIVYNIICITMWVAVE